MVIQEEPKEKLEIIHEYGNYLNDLNLLHTE